MTTSTPAPTPLSVPTPPDAAHVGEWELSDDDRIVQRHFHCGDQTTPSGLHVKVHGFQYIYGGFDGLSIAVSDGQESVMVDAADVEHLVAALRNAADELDRLAGRLG